MLGNSVQRYSRGAILLHWLIALALAAEIAIGFGMPRDASGFELFQFHKSLGITILLLTLVRIGWRLTHKTPPAMEGGFTGFLGKAVHLLLYVFMLGAPLTGWAIVSTSDLVVPTVLFGVLPWPHLPLPGSINHTMEEVHEVLAFVGLALFVLHVAGALRHHVMLRNGLLARMAPGGSAGAALGLFAAVVVLGLGTLMALPGEGEHEHEEEENAAFSENVAASEAAGNEAVSEEDAIEEDEAANEEEEAADEEVVEEEPPEEPVAAGPPPSWDIQPGGSLTFSVDNGGTAINGSFRRWDGSITMDPENPAGSNIAITIEVGSASLGDATQDQMLQGAEFFSTSAFPTATFRSTDVQKTGANSYRANGTLSLKGASRPQSITFTLAGSDARRSVSGNATIERNAFSVGTGDSAAGLAGNVRVQFAFDATR